MLIRPREIDDSLFCHFCNERPTRVMEGKRGSVALCDPCSVELARKLGRLTVADVTREPVPA